MSSEKMGALIYYKHLEILEEAQLSDEQIGKVLRASIKYDKSGEIPQLASPLSAFFMMIKYDLDANRKKWEEVKKIRSDIGKKGGRPPKAKKANGLSESKESNRLFCFQEKPSFSDIKAEAKNIGFFIDESTAQRFSDCGLEPEWLRGPYSFLELAAEKILENYGDKPLGEQKALFISAVKTWDELRDEYLDWKAKKEKRDREAAKELEIKAAWNNHPEKCECGSELHENSMAFWCRNTRNCGAVYKLNKKTLKWERG